MTSLVDGPTGREENRAESGQTSETAKTLEGQKDAFKKALNPTFDLYRCVILHRVPPSSHHLVGGPSHVLDVTPLYLFRCLTSH